jgi:rhomboid protease GluP
MNQFGEKFRLIIIPFLIIAIATNCVYSFLHWWLLIKNEVFVIDEAIVNFALSMVASIIPVLIWLPRRLKLLDLIKKKLKSPIAGYLIFAWIAVWVPTLLAQEYLISATGDLTPLTSITQISDHPKTKYYSLIHAYMDKQQARPYTTINLSGKYNVNYDMAVYLPCPIFDSKAALPKSGTITPLAWLAIKYQKTIKNSLGAADKDREFNLFVKESQDDFDRRDLANFAYLDRIRPSREANRFADAVTFKGVNKTPYIILVPKWGRYEDRNGNKLLWLIGSLVIGILIFILMVATIPLKERTESYPWNID